MSMSQSIKIITLRDYTHILSSLVVLPNGTSDSKRYNKTIKICDPVTRDCLRTLVYSDSRMYLLRLLKHTILCL